MLSIIRYYRFQRRRKQLLLKIRELRRKRFDARRELKDLEREAELTTLAVVGAIVVLWSKIEHKLDLWISIIHHEWGAKHIQVNLPPSLDRELDYLKEAWALRDLDDRLQKDGDRLLHDIHRLKQFRHNLVHGEMDIKNRDALVITVTRVAGAHRNERTVTYSYEQLKARCRDLANLFNDTKRVVESVAEEFVKRHSIKD